MKFHETSFDDYLQSSYKTNFHPELKDMEDNMPHINNMGNLILYGPSGSGKYTQTLRLIKKYSSSELKYDKKITLNSDKYNYIYRISDVHFEIDMALLGCNSKVIWHELFLQIVDIISMSSNKFGIIVCKNFHMIHTELLPIFYSYIQQYNNSILPIQIKYILISEHISFLPNNIINNTRVINIKRPDNKFYKALKMPNYLEKSSILNLKEIHSIKKIDNPENIPKEVFDIICETIIRKIQSSKLTLLELREILYDILTYNLDFIEILWNILVHFIMEEKLNEKSIHEITNSIYIQIKQYNNNYRPIYHLEIILVNIINHIHNYNESSNKEQLSTIQSKKRKCK
jgi:hypothetical protein